MDKEVIQEAVISSGAAVDDHVQERQLRLASIEFQNELIQSEAEEVRDWLVDYPCLLACFPALAVLCFSEWSPRRSSDFFGSALEYFMCVCVRVFVCVCVCLCGVCVQVCYVCVGE
jgi:hypothetical protein